MVQATEESTSSPERFSELLQVAAHPTESDSPSETLAESLGISASPTGQEAIDLVKKDVLSPPKDLAGPDLWRWQAPLPCPVPLPALPLDTRPPTHMVAPSFKGIDGTFTKWRDALAPKPPAHPSLSSSMQREPAAAQNFVRGKSTNAPFLPGGLEPAITYEEAEEELEEEDGWKTRAPGFRRGVQSEGADDFLSQMLGDQNMTTKAKRKTRGGDDPSLQVSRLGDDETTEPGERASVPAAKNVDDSLPIGRSPAPPPARKQFEKVAGKQEWAHVVDVNKELVNFHELVPEMARQYPFELDNFQKEAVYRSEMGDSVFVAAHTSAGKTVVAEYAIALAAKHMTKAIYTSPIKASSNQKFRDFKQTFDPSTVGISTGDVQINPEGSCSIMTTEILRSMLYKGADLIRDVEFVIFDEVHYVNDAERGVVWEEVIIMLPEHVNIILSSATVPNTKEFADWVGRTKRKNIYVISTPMRPVPLEHYLWAGKEIHKIVDSKGQFLGSGYKSAGDALRRKQDKEREAAGLPPLTRTGGRGGAPVKARDSPTGRSAPFSRVGGGRSHTNRGGGQGAPAPANGGRGGGGGGRGSRGGGRPGGRGQLDQNVWTHLIAYLRKNHSSPVVNFVFSKKRCEEYAQTLSTTDSCDSKEKSEVHVTWERALTRLKGTDKTSPQITRMRDSLSRGIGVHHGGLSPIVKEVVEILFARGLVKVLFATETFAMGVNMPAKSVVFSGIRKHDGTTFRNSLPGEYTQMAGRAGRRGLDTTGTVIISSGGDELPAQQESQEMMLGVPNRLTSQFRSTYNMISNLSRVEASRVEEMIKRSFSENAAQKSAPEQQKQIEKTEKILAKSPNVECPTCKPDIEAYYDLSAEIVRVNTSMMNQAAWAPGKHLVPGRIVSIRDARFPGNVAIILRNAPSVVREGVKSDARAYHVLILATKQQIADASKPESKDSELAPRWPPVSSPNTAQNPRYWSTAIESSSIGFVTDRLLKVDVNGISDKRQKEPALKAMNELVKVQEDITSGGELNEVDWARLSKSEFQEQSRNRITLADRVSKLGCQSCKNFEEDYETIHERKLMEGELKSLKSALSDQNLESSPDYESRVEVLKELSFIDENSTVSLKGRVACEINSAPELISTELILDNILADYTPEEAVALSSVFVFVEKTESVPEIPPRIAQGLDTIYAIADNVENCQSRRNVVFDDFREKYKPGLVEVVYEWARGMPFSEITNLTDVPEGTIVRVVTRSDETCREVRDAARVIGDAESFQKMEEAQALIKRDIVFAASLYL